MIDPRETRRILCEWVHQAYAIAAHGLAGNPRLPAIEPLAIGRWPLAAMEAVARWSPLSTTLNGQRPHLSVFSGNPA